MFRYVRMLLSLRNISCLLYKYNSIYIMLLINPYLLQLNSLYDG